MHLVKVEMMVTLGWLQMVIMVENITVIYSILMMKNLLKFMQNLVPKMVKVVKRSQKNQKVI